MSGEFGNNDLWKVILELKSVIPFEKDSYYLSFPVNTGSLDKIVISENIPNPDINRALICFNKESNKGWALNINMTDNCIWPDFENHLLSEDGFSFIERYLPYILIKTIAFRNKSAQTIGHLAMSLDGKIATNTGNSQWIGNKKNQIHSHRMRALSDAILVGGNTYIKDKPQLNVRHVSGDNPKKIIIGDGDYSSNNDDNCNDIIWVNSNSKNASDFEQITIGRNSDGFMCNSLLLELYERGIYTIYIEGGGVTLSGFVNSKSLDIIQLHYAPIIMGSGIPCFDLPEITDVDQALTFKKYSTEKMDDEWMFTGVINYDS